MGRGRRRLGSLSLVFALALSGCTSPWEEIAPGQLLTSLDYEEGRFRVLVLSSREPRDEVSVLLTGTGPGGGELEVTFQGRTDLVVGPDAVKDIVPPSVESALRDSRAAQPGVSVARRIPALFSGTRTVWWSVRRSFESGHFPERVEIRLGDQFVGGLDLERADLR